MKVALPTATPANGTSSIAEQAIVVNRNLMRSLDIDEADERSAGCQHVKHLRCAAF